MTTAAKAPLKSGAVRSLGLLWSVLFLVLAVLAVREALVALEVLGGSLWVAGALAALDGLARGPWLFAVAGVAGVIGLLLVIAAIKPRRRVGLALKANDAIFLAPKAAGSLALASARDVDGVLSASTKVSKSKIDVLAKSTSVNSEVKTAVRTAVDRRLDALATKPTVKVRLRQERSSL